MYKRIILTLAILFATYVTTLNASTTIHKNKESGLLTWSASKDGFSIELIQLLPDFIRAIYAKHDFPAEELERVASYCVFGTIIKNTSPEVMSYKVSDWRYNFENQSYPVKTKTQWLTEWIKAGITFSWTLLPDSGVFEVGDWQQGFTTVALPRNSEFELILEWSIDGKTYNNTIKNIVCAPDDLPASQ